MKCKHCGQPVQVGKSHHCEQMKRAGRSTPVTPRSSSDDGGGDFVLSAAVGYATNSAAVGALVGGSLLGGITGDLLNNED